MLCLKHPFLGNGGIKHPEADDLRFTDMFISSALDKLLDQLGIYATWLSSNAYLGMFKNNEAKA